MPTGIKEANKIEMRKDLVFRELAAVFQEAGYQVRRERLKQGHGWKVVSGSCRHEDRKLVFVDRKLAPDDQIGFLVSKISALGISISPEQLQRIPERWRSIFEK